MSDTFYSELRHRFAREVTDAGLSSAPVEITCRVLTPEEAIGSPTRTDYPILIGKEVMIQAACCGSVGQAFTDHPSEFSGTLGDVLDLPLDDPQTTALFVATVNAAMRHLHPDMVSVHCHDDEPERCAQQLADEMAARGVSRIGLIGLQPAMLAALSVRFGPESVRCLDRNKHTIGTTKHGVVIEAGTNHALATLCAFADVLLCTGSTVVNHTLPGIAACAAQAHTPIVYYGISIAGTAQLLGLERYCPLAA